jgi:16S rRNA (uracil1498-N3)-methyltransferase
MSEHRFYAGDGALAGLEQGCELTLPADAAHRIARVLRLRPGNQIGLFADGREFVCELVETGRRARARVLSEQPPAPSQRRLVLYAALVRPNRFEWLIEKVTEVGVAAIVPVVSERCAVRPEEIGAARLERWHRIAVEAAEQCGRRTVPAIAAPVPFPDALGRACGRIVLAWEGLRADPAPPALPFAAGHDPLSLFIGPEGGWSEAEVERARAAGAALLGLGANVLRAETAAIVASALLLLG